MSLRVAWCVYIGYSCCHNCIHSYVKEIDKVDHFFCKGNVKIPNNHWSKINSYTCINHRWNDSFKIKKRITKNKCKMIVKKQLIKKTIIKECI